MKRKTNWGLVIEGIWIMIWVCFIFSFYLIEKDLMLKALFVVIIILQVMNFIKSIVRAELEQLKQDILNKMDANNQGK